MAFRSAEVRFDNMTGLNLRLIQSELDHGEFASNPPATILPDQSVSWRAESADLSILTGTEGTVGYSPDGTSVVIKFRWDVPAVGQSGMFFFTENDTAGDFLFFAREFGFPLNGGAGLHAFGPFDTDGPIAPPFILNPFSDIGITIGLRDRRSPIRIKRWMRSLGLNPESGVRAIGRRFERPNFSLRTFIGPPSDWNTAIMS